MKAKIKETGEIINIAKYAKITLDICNGYGNPVEVGPEDIELIQEESKNNIDWEQVRIQASISAIRGILSNEEEVNFACYDAIYREEESNIHTKGIAKYAVACADALIKELKG